MHPLTTLLLSDRKPALGVTEPGAIAFAVAKAKSYLSGEIAKISLSLNSGLYKNAFTCGIPNSSAVGNAFAAALGAVAGNPEKGLMSLDAVTEEDNRQAQILIDAGVVQVVLDSISPEIYIRAIVCDQEHTCTVIIKDRHTNITEILLDDLVIFPLPGQQDATGQSNAPQTGSPCSVSIHRYTLDQLLNYVNTVPLAELEALDEAYPMNLALFEEGLHSDRTRFVHHLLKKNGGERISKDPLATAQLLCNGAIEARVIGLNKPAMSITGSGAHGIICTLPLYAYAKVSALPKEKLLRATALSYLITIYIKEYSGQLSAFCGCAIAAGTGMACGLGYLADGSLRQLDIIIRHMASSITGMICDGGNQGCTMKGVVAVDTAFRALDFTLSGVEVLPVHGINGATPEQTMRHMGLIASPGMEETERMIVQIMQEK